MMTSKYGHHPANPCLCNVGYSHTIYKSSCRSYRRVWLSNFVLQAIHVILINTNMPPWWGDKRTPTTLTHCYVKGWSMEPSSLVVDLILILACVLLTNLLHTRSQTQPHSPVSHTHSLYYIEQLLLYLLMLLEHSLCAIVSTPKLGHTEPLITRSLKGSQARPAGLVFYSHYYDKLLISDVDLFISEHTSWQVVIICISFNSDFQLSSYFLKWWDHFSDCIPPLETNQNGPPLTKPWEIFPCQNTMEASTLLKAKTSTT